MNELKEEQQRIFNIVVEHLLTQKAPAFLQFEDMGSCRYRQRIDENTVRKCAIGCLIADEFYSQKLEGSTLSFTLVKDALKKSGVKYLDNFQMIVFLTELQRIHDSEAPIRLQSTTWSFYTRVRARLLEFANKRELNTEIFNKFPEGE